MEIFVNYLFSKSLDRIESTCERQSRIYFFKTTDELNSLLEHNKRADSYTDIQLYNGHEAAVPLNIQHEFSRCGQIIFLEPHKER
ncbi:hypothetical protein [Gynuella sp.]|uniref:hypothetical protein n=1 Tax=Gynuella sp. TaxID=2969146 RepID=UPI003D0CF674